LTFNQPCTTTLFAALDVATGEVITQCKPRHRHQEFLGFLRQIEKSVPGDLDIHLVVDNYCTNKSLRKNRQKRGVHPSRDLITRCSGWISLIQRFRTPDFRRFAPLGLPGSRLIGTHLGNPLLMPPPSPV